MVTHFWADTHFGAQSILNFSRFGFSSIEEHDDFLISQINSFVSSKDRFFILGDFAWRAQASYLEKINCKNIHLIQGNHDKASTAKLFKTVSDVAEIKINGQKIFLSHYPHAYWPASHRGSIHLYGHIHAKYEDFLNKIWPNRRSIDCGVDNSYKIFETYKPFSENDIFELLLSRPGHENC